MRLQNKVAIVTGSLRGIGRAIAESFAKEGAKVVIADFVYEEVLAQELIGILKNYGGDGIALQADVSQKDQVAHMFERTLDAFGTVDILVNNAGIARRAPFLDLTLDEWNEVLRNNLTSMILCSQEAAKIMLKKKYGRIINMSSVRGQRAGGNPNALAYSVAKAGVDQLTTTLAKELAPYITVNAVAPSFIDTDIAKGWSDKTREEAMNVYLQRLVRPEEVAEAFVYFASSNASATTGQILAIDGGYLLK